MSRYVDHSDDDSPEAVLAYGRWQHNARAALKGRRGRQALRDMREALIALPEHRLIDGAVCTVGSPEARVPDVTEHERAEYIARTVEQGHAQYAEQWAAQNQEWREQERAALAAHIQAQGHGVCAVGAYAWWKLVKGGMNPAEAFAVVPTALSEDGADGLEETAYIGEKAGMTFTLAWELAYRNDETLGACTPEERWERFMQWIDNELAEVPA